MYMSLDGCIQRPEPEEESTLMVNFGRTQRRMVRATLGLVAVAFAGTFSLAAPTMASATTATSSTHSALTVRARPAAAGAGARAGEVREVTNVTLQGAQCTALRGQLHDAGASCSITESLRLTRVSQAASYVYWYGYLQACAEQSEPGAACSGSWKVTDRFNFTSSGSQVWDNGTPKCAATGNTKYTWCGYTNNGDYQMVEGFNYGNNGWARMYINANGTYSVNGSSSAFATGSKSPV